MQIPKNSTWQGLIEKIIVSQVCQFKTSEVLKEASPRSDGKRMGRCIGGT